MKTPNDTIQLRRVIADLSRRDARKLAADVGIASDELIDYAEAGIAPSQDVIIKLGQWHERVQLRKACNDASRQINMDDLHRATGITQQACTDFIGGADNLTSEQEALLRSFIRGGMWLAPDGTYRAVSVKPEVVKFRGGNGQDLTDIQRRGELMNELRALSTPDLEKIVAGLKTTRTPVAKHNETGLYHGLGSFIGVI